MLFGLIKQSAPKSQAQVQYIGFPVESFDFLSKEGKDNYYREINAGGWQFALRALGWIIESRVSDQQQPRAAEGQIFGIAGARAFSQKEVDDLREHLRMAEESSILSPMSQEEEKLKEAFDVFAGKTGLVRAPYLRVIRVLCRMAAKGCEVSVEDIRSNPTFSRLGNIPMLFGDRLKEVLAFQNEQARLVAATK